MTLRPTQLLSVDTTPGRSPPASPVHYYSALYILTSNKGFAEWGELLGDTVIATAMLDRLLHHSHVLNIRGESHRLRDKRQAGLLTSHKLLTAPSEDNTDS